MSIIEKIGNLFKGKLGIKNKNQKIKRSDGSKLAGGNIEETTLNLHLGEFRPTNYSPNVKKALCLLNGIKSFKRKDRYLPQAIDIQNIERFGIGYFKENYLVYDESLANEINSNLELFFSELDFLISEGLVKTHKQHGRIDKEFISITQKGIDAL